MNGLQSGPTSLLNSQTSQSAVFMNNRYQPIQSIKCVSKAAELQGKNYMEFLNSFVFFPVPRSNSILKRG